MANATIANNQYQAEIYWLEPSHFDHSKYDQKKLSKLVEDMKTNGWKGAPLVAYDGWLLTGSHRFAAAKLAGLQKIPAVDYNDVFVNADEDEVLAAFECEGWVATLTRLAFNSDPEIAQELGMDADQI